MHVSLDVLVLFDELSSPLGSFSLFLSCARMWSVGCSLLSFGFLM